MRQETQIIGRLAWVSSAGWAALCIFVVTIDASNAKAAQPATSNGSPESWKTTLVPTNEARKRKRSSQDSKQPHKSDNKLVVPAPRADAEKSLLFDAAPQKPAGQSDNAVDETKPAAVEAVPNLAPSPAPERAVSGPASSGDTDGFDVTKTTPSAKGTPREPTPSAPEEAAIPQNAELHKKAATPENRADDADNKKTTSYCLNIANAAVDARYLLQKRRLEELKAEIKSRTEELQTKIVELREWYAKRESFVSKARENLVGIYASMKAEAAAKQLSEMDEETSSALLAKLDARQSSAVLSEMESKKAARLTEIMAGAVKVPTAPSSRNPPQTTNEANPRPDEANAP